MQAVILAGGKGTRLGTLTAELPKPMIPVGDQPIIEHQIRLLKQANITEVIILVNHLKQPLMDYLKDGSQFGVNISYFEEPEPLGTAGAFPLIKDQLEDDFLVLYGDVMLDMDFELLIQFHQKNDADATLVIHPNDHPHDSDLVEINAEKQIIAFHSKPHQEGKYYKNMVNAGAYVFTKKVISALSEPIKSDFGKDIFPEWVKNFRLFGYNTPEYLKDMGTPDRLEKVTQDLLSGKIARRNLRFLQKAIFLDRDGVINEDRHLIHTPEELVLYPYTTEAIKKINQSDYLSVVVTNQSVVARNLCSIEELEYIHKKLDTELGEKGAKLDELYYCPYHPDKGYPEENPDYKMEHPWRKPNPGMLLQAQEDFNIDLSQSFMIGDRNSDVEAGQNAGTKTIALRSGYGCKKLKSKPDYWFDDLQQAIDFIIDDPLKGFCEQVFKKIDRSKNELTVILVGGNAQSGKSTLASRLAFFLEEQNLENQRIALDDFLLEKEKRAEAKEVFERFQLNDTSAKINALIDGQTINYTPYHKDPNQERTEETLAIAANTKVLIIEGVPALSLNLDFKNLINIFVSTSLEAYKQNFRKLYAWKGFDSSAIETLLQTRIQDEFEHIAPHISKADFILEQ